MPKFLHRNIFEVINPTCCQLSNMTDGQSSLISLAHHCCDWHPGSRCGWTCNQLTSKVCSGSQFSPSVRPHNSATRFRLPSATVVSAEPFSYGTGTLRCLWKEMATYRHWLIQKKTLEVLLLLRHIVQWHITLAACFSQSSEDASLQTLLSVNSIFCFFCRACEVTRHNRTR